MLDLKGYDFILGVHWIYTHSPIGLNLKTREFCMNHYGKHKIIFKDETLPEADCVVTIEKLQKLMEKGVMGAVVYACDNRDELHKLITPPVELMPILQRFKAVFDEPRELPPKRKCDHSIPLKAEDQHVTQRPYRLPFHQKNALEGIIEQLLNSKTIRPSVSPYSSPAILVKKKDRTWRMCIDYEHLNANSIKI